jgi:tyramine---L-glutamate ligase
VRILLHEFVTGGGMAGRAVPRSLAHEGAAMRDAVATDVVALGRHQLVVTEDARFPGVHSGGIEVEAIGPGNRSLDSLMASADAVWIIAPESNGCLALVTARAERTGRMVIGTPARAIARASHKGRLATVLNEHNVPHPATRMLRRGDEPEALARSIGYPVVVKPTRGAGCEGVSIASDGRALRAAIASARACTGGSVLLQRYVQGVAASVSLLAAGDRVVPLSVNAQFVDGSRSLSYAGGETPLVHALASRAAEAAVRACRAVGGLRGFVGADLVLTASDAIVIEINPRVTTAYVGLRAAVDVNVAGLVLAACRGRLPRHVRPRRRVRFSSSGAMLASMQLPPAS